MVESIITATHARSRTLVACECFFADSDDHVLRVARLSIEREIEELKAGDFVRTPAHQKHPVEWKTQDQPRVLLAVFY